MYMAHISVRPFKDKRIRSQVPTCASTPNQFRSSWRPGSNHTLWMRTGPSLLRKGHGRGTPPLQAPNRRSLLLSKLILAPVTSSCLLTVFFTAFMSIRRDTKVEISSAYTETFALTQPAKRNPRKARFAVPSLSLRSGGYKERT